MLPPGAYLLALAYSLFLRMGLTVVTQSHRQDRFVAPRYDSFSHAVAVVLTLPFPGGVHAAEAERAANRKD